MALRELLRRLYVLLDDALWRPPWQTASRRRDVEGHQDRPADCLAVRLHSHHIRPIVCLTLRRPLLPYGYSYKEIGLGLGLEVLASFNITVNKQTTSYVLRMALRVLPCRLDVILHDALWRPPWETASRRRDVVGHQDGPADSLAVRLHSYHIWPIVCLTLRQTLLPYGYSYRASCARQIGLSHQL